MKPITPKDVKQKRIADIPDDIIQATNNMITKKWDGYSASVTLTSIIDEYFKLIGEKRTHPKSNLLLDNHYLDIEPIFENAGWNVVFDNPAYNENYDAFFTFKANDNEI